MSESTSDGKGKVTINEKNLTVSFLQFLRQKISSNTCTDEQIEALEVAVQCLESAFSVSDKNYAFQTSKPLLEIFEAAEGLPASEEDLPKPLPAEIDEADRLKEEGNELAKNGNWQMAIIKYNEAIKLHRSPIYFCNRAAAYCRLEQFDLAIQDCRTAVALDPTYAKAWGRMGVALSSQNRYEQAIEAYTKALEIDPENASYNQNISIAREKLREAQQSQPQGGMPNPMNLGNLLNNPQMMEMATQMISDPNVQNLMSQMMNSFMGMGQGGAGGATGAGSAPGIPGNLEGFLRAGETMAQRMESENPQLVEQLRNAFNTSHADGSDNPPPSNNADDNQS